MSTQPYRFRHADSGGSPSLTTARAMRLTPAELPLTLSADVLRLPYQPAVRFVLAEIISLHEATRSCCDASDQHLADRLTISLDTVSRAIKQLHADGLITKVVDKYAGFHRTMAPVPAAIEAKAATNPYPERAGSYPQNAGRGTTRNLPLGYPQNAASPTRNLRMDLPADCGTNTSTLNLPLESSTTLAGASHEAAESEAQREAAPAGKEGYHPEDANASASHTGARRGADDEPAGFAEFYAAYPKREKRREAAAAFRRLSLDDQRQALARSAAWFAARPDLAQPERQRYIPYPASWLSAARWTDETPTAHSLPHAATSASHSPTAPAGQISKRRDAARDAQARIHARYAATSHAD